MEIDFIANYLDDFLFIAVSANRCNKLVKMFLELCEELGVPVAEDKTEWGTIRIVFLGILLDGEKFLLTVPEDKRMKAVNMLNLMISKKKSTVKDMEKLAGFLNFLNKAVVPGRAFMRRMYSKFTNQKTTLGLKGHHHVKLDKEFKDDCKVWLEFLEAFNKTTLCRPFVDLNETTSAEVLGFYSDATAKDVFGYGCVYNNEWTYNKWEPGFIKRYEGSINIEFLELFALCTGIFTWINHFTNHRIIVFCDNQSIVSMVNNMTSGCKFCMMLIRELTLKCLKANLRVFARHVKEVRNILSDSLSRQDLPHFFRHAASINWKLNDSPTETSSELWPLSKFWEAKCKHMIKM